MLELLPKTPRARNYRHGYKTSGKYASEYSIWSGMRARCYNEKNPTYQRYGARGVRVCPEWRENFLNFLRDMGRRPSPDHSLDRINNNGNYEPGNCKWSTRQEQCRNRRSSRLITLGSVTKTQAEWSDETGISQGTIYSRLKNGWSPERALTTPT